MNESMRSLIVILSISAVAGCNLPGLDQAREVVDGQASGATYLASDCIDSVNFSRILSNHEANLRRNSVPHDAEPVMEFIDSIQRREIERLVWSNDDAAATQILHDCEVAIESVLHSVAEAAQPVAEANGVEFSLEDFEVAASRSSQVALWHVHASEAVAGYKACYAEALELRMDRDVELEGFERLVTETASEGDWVEVGDGEASVRVLGAASTSKRGGVLCFAVMNTSETKILYPSTRVSSRSGSGIGVTVYDLHGNDLRFNEWQYGGVLEGDLAVRPGKAVLFVAEFKYLPTDISEGVRLVIRPEAIGLSPGARSAVTIECATGAFERMPPERVSAGMVLLRVGRSVLAADGLLD